MPFDYHKQPNQINIDKELRLIKAERESWLYALEWYQNPDVLYYSEGVTETCYDMEVITNMYSFLSSIGELYFIEILENGIWKVIGDATLSEKTMPIVIGYKEYWGKGIGKKVIGALIIRAKELGIKKIQLSGIYIYNERSKNMFMSLGFKKTSQDDNKEKFELVLEKN